MPAALSLATMPASIRDQVSRLNTDLQRKFEARVRAMQVLTAESRAHWRSTAERLASELAPVYGRGFSAKSLLNLHRDFRARGAEALSFGYGHGEAVPDELKAFLSARIERNKRVASVELDAVVSEWRAGTPIPGIGSWQDCWREEFRGEPVPEYCPAWYTARGLSTRNLRRKLAGSAQTLLARRGYFAAHGQLPQLRFDYRNLRPLELVIFDDVKMDWLVSVPGQTRGCEFWMLVARDAATRVYLDWVSLVAVPDDEGRKQSLLEEHMRILAGQLLLKYGVPTGYASTWIVENAKATLRADDRSLLASLTGNAVDVRLTRMVDRALPGGWEERHGTPWGPKAIIESSFRALHDHGGALPGQTGSLQVLNKPADLEAMQKEQAALMRELEGLPAEVIERIRAPFLTNAEAVDTVAALFGKLNNRHEHQLQGFEKVQLWRFPEDADWRPLDDLRRYDTTAVRRAIFHPGRIESPLERMERLLKQQERFCPIPDDTLIPFLARSVRRVSHPAPYTLRWKDDGVEQVYRGELKELESGDGGPFSVKILPHNVAIAYVYDEAGRRLGTVNRVHAPSPLDQEGTERALGELQHYRSLVTKPVLERHAPEAEANAQRRAQNAAIIAAAREGRAMVEQGAAAEQTRKTDTAATRAKNLARQRALAEAAKATLSNA